MNSTNISFRAVGSMLNRLQVRDGKSMKNPGTIARRDLDRWYGALQDALEDVRLAPAEAILLIRLVNRADQHDEDFVAGLAAYVADRPEDGFAHVQRRLAQKLAAFDRITRWALVDAAERYAVFQHKHPGATLGMALHQVGLHSYDVTPGELAALEATEAAQPGELAPIGQED